MIARSKDWAWTDSGWMKSRGSRCALDQAVSIYQVHLDSWMRVPEEQNRPLNCVEIAPKLASYCRHMGFTHVEFLGEHSPDDLTHLVSYMHQHEIGVILDYYRMEERAFTQETRQQVVENIFAQIEECHVDGLRIPEVNSIIRADNHAPEQEKSERIRFLQQLNADLYRRFPDIQTFAEERTAWPRVSRPVEMGGLGFGFKWDMDWARDILTYLGIDPIQRKFHHHLITARNRYAFSENFVLPLSHEMVEGSGSLLSKMWGNEWQKFANFRLLLANQFAQPGKKLIFMGTEFAQWQNWNVNSSLDWHLLRDSGCHNGIERITAQLNHLYRQEEALHAGDAEPWGFEWINRDDMELSTASWIRKNRNGDETIVAVFNFTPVVRHNFRVGVPVGGFWREVFNSDAREFGGSGQGNCGGLEASPFAWNGQPRSLTILLPPLAAIFFKVENSQ